MTLCPICGVKWWHNGRWRILTMPGFLESTTRIAGSSYTLW